MKIGVTGYKGFVGSRLVKLGYQPIDVDVTDAKATKEIIQNEKFDVIIYAAGVTDVEYCQRRSSEASNVNVRGVVNIVDWFNGTFIYLSSDHVFRGNKFWPGGYSEKHRPSPVNIYGLSKIAGETMASLRNKPTKIIRTSKLFDYDKLNPVLDLVDAGGEVTLSNVLRRSYLHVDHFVEGLKWVIDNLDKTPEILNVSGTDMFTIYRFFSSVLRHLKMDEGKLIPRNELLKIATPRPIRAGLNVSKARKLGVPLYSGYDGIKLL